MCLRLISQRFICQPKSLRLMIINISVVRQTSSNSESMRVPNFSFKEVNNDSIIKEFSFGMINPQLLKMPDIEHSDTVMKDVIKQLDNLPSDISSDNCLKYLKKIGLFGTSIPCRYGGLGLSLTHNSYLMQHERLADWVLTLISHQNLCAHTILHYGNEEQKNKYLPILASGSKVGAWCLTENTSGSDIFSMETVGVLNGMEDHYVVDGEKNWVINGAIADILVVFVLTQDSKYEGGREYITAFIVDTASEGVSITTPYNIPCLINSFLTDVSFKSVFVPVENVLSEDNAGYKIANYIQNNARYMVGSCLSGWTRSLINDLIAKDKTLHFTNDLHMKDLFNDCVTYLYAIDSTCSFTSRFADRFESPEFELESSAVKVFSAESAKKIVENYLQIMSMMVIPVASQESLLCDRVNYIQSFLGSNYFVRLYIGGTMIQLSEYTFIEIRDRLKRPLQNASWLLKKAKDVDKDINWTEHIDDSRYGSIIHGTVFLSDLKEMYKNLQISRLQLCKALNRFQQDTLDHQFIIEAMSHVGVLIYVISCCVARANTNFGDFEIACTRLFLDQARIIIDESVTALTDASKDSIDTLFPVLIKDIKLAEGYPIADVLNLRQNFGDHH